MKKYFLLPLLLLSLPAFTQGKIFFLRTMDSLNPNMHYCTDNTYRSNELVYKIAPVPAELQNAVPQNVDLTVGLNMMVNSFQFEHITYGSILPGYSIFALGNHSVFKAVKWSETAEYDQDSAARVACRKAVFSKRTLLEVLYTWAMPVYQAAFQQMTYKEQHDYLSMLDNALDYANDFELAREKYDMDTMGSAFAYYKGKVHAFIFRRIFNNELTKEECISWLTRIISDLKKVQMKTHKAEDDMILKLDIGYGYFLCSDWRYAGRNDGRSRIGRYRKGKFELLSDPEFARVDAAMWGLVTGKDAALSNSKPIMFQFDSATSRVFTLKKPIAPITYFLLGSTNAPRLMVMTRTSMSQDEGEFLLFDVSNTTQVGELFAMPVMATADPNTGGNIYMLMDAGGAYIIRDIGTSQFGLMDLNGKIVVTPTHAKITKGKKPGQFKVDGKKFIVPS